MIKIMFAIDGSQKGYQGFWRLLSDNSNNSNNLNI